MNALPFDLQLLNTLAALLLLISFAMLSQRRIVTLVNLLAVQGALLCLATLLLAWRTGANHLYFSAALTLGLKVLLLPWLLHRLIRRLGVYWDTEPLLNISGTMLLGVLIVIFSFGLAQPISALASTATRSAIGIAVACEGEGQYRLLNPDRHPYLGGRVRVWRIVGRVCRPTGSVRDRRWRTRMNCQLLSSGRDCGCQSPCRSDGHLPENVFQQP